MSFSANRNRLMLIITAIILAVLISTGLLQHQLIQRQAEQDTLKHGEMLLRQTSLLANPLLQANDRVSLNYLLNELISLPYIEAAQLNTNREGVIARAGSAGGIEMQQALSSKQDSHLSIWLNPTPFVAPMQRQLINSAIAALIALALCLLAIGLLLRGRPGTVSQRHTATAQTTTKTPVSHPAMHASPTDRSTDEPPHIATGAQPSATTQPNTSTKAIHMYNNVDDLDLNAEEKNTTQNRADLHVDESITPADTGSVTPQTEPTSTPTMADKPTDVIEDDVPFTPAFSRISASKATPDGLTTPPSEQIQTDATAAQPDAAQEATATNTDAQVSPDPIQPVAEESTGVAGGADILPAQNVPEGTTPVTAQQIPAESSSASVASAVVAPHAQDTESLLSLLKPAEHTEAIPTFTPQQPAAQQSATPQTATARHASAQPTTTGTPPARSQQPARKPNPLLSGQVTPPPSSYLAEHEQELTPDAKDASYCIYIDSSAHAGNTETGEREQLLTFYKQLASRSAALYNGTLGELKNGDFVIQFTKPLPDDSHGINATCAAMLFNLLYREFNQMRIRAFRPSLNLRMSLARGHQQQTQRLLEEARLLTNTTDTNALISHTALTEAQTLQHKLLKFAKLRRDEEDKVLIHALPDNVQKLLTKQAEQLLSKLETEPPQ